MNHFELLLSRRGFFKTMSSAVVTLCLQDSPLFAKNKCRKNKAFESSSDFLKKYGPIDRTLGDMTPATFSGDDFTRAHPILWDIPGFLSTHTVEGTLEKIPVAIVGGGASGLFSAYCLRDLKPIVLELGSRLGGNAKGESWKGLDYALGSAYLDVPTPGTPMYRYYDELGWKSILTERSTGDPVEFEGKLYSNFWAGETEKNEQTKYDRINHFFRDLYAEKDGLIYPSIPALTSREMQALESYDHFDLLSFLVEKAGGPLPPHLHAAVEHYCWSTFAASAKELSAAAALNFLAQETNPICAAPGGNARLLEPLIEKLLIKMPSSNLRTNSLVIQVKVENSGVRITYVDERGKLRALLAQRAILACPKFIAKKILVGIEKERVQAIEKLEYRAYLTAHVLLKKPVALRFYDMFMMGKGKTTSENPGGASQTQNATDFVLANFASPRNDISILTLYRAFPFDGGRQELYQSNSYSKYKLKFENQIEKSILPLLGLEMKDVTDLRLTRWGHALPVSAKGLFQRKMVESLRSPFERNVYFVEQDNWAYPAFETGAIEADVWSDAIRKSFV